jgi:hypothetical protein
MSPQTPRKRATRRGPASLAQKRQQVQGMLVDVFGSIEVTRDGDFTFPFESTRVYIRPFKINARSTVVNVYAITNVDVPPSEPLFRFVALNADAALFGHLAALERDDVVDIVFSHRLLADYLDKQELQRAVVAVATSANEVDDIIKDNFGGQRYRDLVEGAPPVDPPATPAQPGGYL